MPVRMIETNGGKVLEVQLAGTLTRKDYEQFTPEFERVLNLHGKISILVEMRDFHGWEVGAAWEDIKLDCKHYSDIERIGMVGDKKWEKGMSVICRPFTSAKIRFFEWEHVSEARAWVEGRLEPVAT